MSSLDRARRRQNRLLNQRDRDIQLTQDLFPEEAASGGGLMDSNPLYDLVGNAIWGFGETFMVPTVFDIGLDGKVSGTLGSQEWKDESLAGKIGYGVGTAVGLFTGIGAVGKGIQQITKAGAKQTAKRKIKNKILDSGIDVNRKMATKYADELYTTTASSIKAGQLLARKDLKWYNFIQKHGLKQNPLNHPAVADKVFTSVTKSIQRDLGLKGESLTEMMKLVSKTTAEAPFKHFGNRLSTKLINRGWNSNVATRIGDAAFEGVLLGIYDVVIGEAADAVAHFGFGMEDGEGQGEWKYKPWYERALHGIAVGGLLSQTRTIAGGKQVSLFQTGMMADLKKMTSVFRNRFRNVKDMSPSQKQGILKVVYESSGRNNKIFDNVAKGKIGSVLLGKKHLTTADNEILTEGVLQLQKQLPKVLGSLSKEISKDAFFSSGRAGIGSFVMNYTGWKEVHEQGILGTEDYPWDKFAVDFWVGWVYAKRPKSIAGEGFGANIKFKEYYAQTGRDAKGSELHSTLKFMEAMGTEETNLPFMATFAGNDLDLALQQKFIRREVKGNRDLALLDNVLKKNLVEGSEYAAMLQEGQGKLNHWTQSIMFEIEAIKGKMTKATEGTKKHQELKEAYENLIEKQSIAQVIENAMMIHHPNKAVKPMSVPEAYEYMNSLANLKVKDGQVAFANADQTEMVIKELRETNTQDITEAIRLHSERYILDSLEKLGLATEGQKDNQNRIMIHETILSALEQARTLYPKRAEAFYQLAETIKRSVDVGEAVITDNPMAMQFKGQTFKGKLDMLQRVYENSTEQLHDITFGTSDMPNWRDNLPGYKKTREFFDPNILSSPPIWHAIGTVNRLARHRHAYDSFIGNDVLGPNIMASNETSKQFNRLREIFGGQRKIEFTELEIDGGKITADLISFKDRINSVRDLLNPETVGGTKKVTASQLEAIRDKMTDPVDGFGNLFTEPGQFNEFRKYIYRRFVDDISGNVNIGDGLKDVIVQLISDKNPLAIRRSGKLEIITSKTLREVLGEDKVTVGDFKDYAKKEIDRLITDYEQKVENKLREQLTGRSGTIRFAEAGDYKPVDIDRADILQSLRNVVNSVDRVASYEIKVLNDHYLDLGASLKGIQDRLGEMEIVSKKGTAHSDLLEGMKLLSDEAGNLKAQLSIYLATNDAVGLRTLLDGREQLNKITKAMEVDLLSDSQTIKDYHKALETYRQEAFDKRNSILNFSEIENVNEYIREQMEDISVQNRHDKVKNASLSISDNKYLMKWFNEKDVDFLEIIKKNPIELLNKVENLDKQAQNFVDTWKKNPSIKLNLETNALYVDHILKPILESQRIRIEKMTEKHDQLGKTPEERWNNFVMDTFTVLSAGLNNKEVSIGLYDNGVLSLDKVYISTWEVGFNKLETSLGLSNMSGALILGAKKHGSRRGYSTRYDRTSLDQLKSRMSEGTFLDVSSKEILSGELKRSIDDFALQIAGTGAMGSTKYFPIQLDGNTMIFAHKSAFEVIAREFNAPEGRTRRELLAAMDGIVPNPKQYIENYLKNEMGMSFSSSGLGNAGRNVDVISKIILLNRMLNFDPDATVKMIMQNASPEKMMSTLKYFKLDNPRTGTNVSDRTLDFTNKYYKTFMPKDSPLRDAYGIFKEHVFDPKGESTKHRKIVINDESGSGKDFFNTSVRGKAELTQQLIDKYGLSKDIAEAKTAELMEVYDLIPASRTNAEAYLSLPEMVSLLMTRGARDNWFVRDKNNNITGFNIVIKPIELHSSINVENGAVSVFAGKTAYKFNPAMDNMMKNKAGEYILDSITFESASKKNVRKLAGGKEYESQTLDYTGTKDINIEWFADLAAGVSIDKSKIIELPRESIFIKSLNGAHDATQSSALVNFLSNDANRALQGYTKSMDNVNDMLFRYSQLRDNPFSYQAIGQMLKSNLNQSGDMTARLMGLEGVIENGGLPTFEYMQGQFDRMLTSEYLGSRSFTSSELVHGGYNTMTAGSGLSLPVRDRTTEHFQVKGVQTSFGGSGIPFHQSSKSVTNLLMGGQPGHGLNLGFTIDAGLIKQFPKLSEMLKQGHDMVVTHDGRVVGPHKFIKPANKSVEKELKVFEEFMIEKYNELLGESVNAGAKDFKDLLLFLDGQEGSMLKDNFFYDKDIFLDNKSPTSAANRLKFGDDKLFQAVHGMNTDLRTPKIGVNDWVLTKIEKLIDRRKGPVSEMNMLDAIDPQDADFDLDKSSSFHALPGLAVEEMYNVSGFIDPGTKLFESVLEEYKPLNAAKMEDYALRMRVMEDARPQVMRSHSIGSFLLQMYTSGTPKDRVLWNWRDQGNYPLTLGGEKGLPADYRIVFAGGQELAGSIQYMKKLIKATIDIYKDPQGIETKDVSRLVWLDPELGMLRLEMKNKKGEWVREDWQNDAMPADVKSTAFKIVDEVLNPIGSIFDMANLTENYMDGTSRRLSIYDMVSRFQTAKNRIMYAGLTKRGIDGSGYDRNGRWVKPKENHLYNFTNRILSFLGTSYIDRGKPNGTSEHILIKGLMAMEKSVSQHFQDRIPYDSSLGALMAGALGKGDKDISMALGSIVKDQKKWAQLNYLTYELDQMYDTMQSMKSRRQHGTIRFSKLEKQYAFKTSILKAFELEINNPELRKNEMMRFRPGKHTIPFKWNKVGWYRENKETGEVFLVDVVQGGDRITSRYGDTFLPNYKIMRMGNDVVSKQRRAMHRAFARDLYALSKGNILEIDNIILKDYNKAIVDASNLIDPNAPKTNTRYGILSEAQVQVTAEYLGRAITAGAGVNGEHMGMQFLYRLLTPKIDGSVTDIVGQNNFKPHFAKNSQRERLVMATLDRLRLNKLSSDIVSSEMAQRYFETILEQHKIGFVKEFDPTLEGQVFNFASSKRRSDDFSILSMPEQLPGWATSHKIGETTLNARAKDVMLSYLNGTYFLSPLELYRMTLDLRKTDAGFHPDFQYGAEFIRNAWKGTDHIVVDPSGNWAIGRKTVRNAMYESETYNKGQNGYEYFKEAYKKLCGG